MFGMELQCVCCRIIMEMLVLFVNAHRKNEQGRMRFENFCKTVRAALRGTVYFGNEVVQTVRQYDQLEDYIFDEVTFRTEERVRHKFESLEYVIVDGSCGFYPWADCMADLLLLVRKCIDAGKKILCHGWAHFAASYYLATNFDKHYTVSSNKTQAGRTADFEFEEETGDLKMKGARVGNSGLQVGGSRPFADKSSQAVARGLTLGSKFQYAVFEAKSGSRLLKGIVSPFSFYWKSKLFCTPRSVSQSKAQVLFETESGAPLAFVHKNLLSVQGLCPQFIRLLTNWLLDHTQRSVQSDQLAQQAYQSIAFQNKFQFRKTLSSSASQLRTGKSFGGRPQSSKFSTVQFDKPVVRCSGKYETVNERYLHEQLRKKSMNIGRSRLLFDGKLDKFQIGTYVQREPSRPASSHKFREVHKEKWLGSRDFFNC